MRNLSHCKRVKLWDTLEYIVSLLCHKPNLPALLIWCYFDFPTLDAIRSP